MYKTIKISIYKKKTLWKLQKFISNSVSFLNRICCFTQKKKSVCLYKIKRKTEDLREDVNTALRKIMYDLKKNGKHVTVKTDNEELKKKEVIHIFKYNLNVAHQRITFLRKYCKNLI